MKSRELFPQLASRWPGDSLLPVILGSAATLAFAPFGYFPLAFLAIAGLLWLWWDVSPLRAFWRGWLFGFVHFCCGIYWVFISIHRYGGAPAWLAVLLVIVLSAYLAMYPAIVGYASRRWLSANLLVTAFAALPAAWVLAELVRGWLGSGFPWLSLGYAMIDAPLNKLAPVIGVYGLSGVVLLLSGALWLLIAGAQRERRVAGGVVVVIALVVLLLPPRNQWTRDAGAPITVALVQGNIPQEIKWRQGRREMIQAQYRALSADQWGRRLVIWPEVAIPALRSNVEGYLIETQQTAVEHGSTLLLGILVGGGENEPLYNGVLALGQDTGAYYKRHLVPFGEFFPIPLFLVEAGELLGLQYSNFSHGPPVQEPIRVGPNVIGLSICFEDAFGDEIRRALPDAAVLVNLTNDAWFADSLAPHQHLEIARMRALETGRTLLRVANTGISGVIGPDGEMVARTPQFEAAVIQAEATPRTGLTPYARFGDKPLWILSFLTLVLLAGFAWYQRRG